MSYSSSSWLSVNQVALPAPQALLHVAKITATWLLIIKPHHSIPIPSGSFQLYCCRWACVCSRHSPINSHSRVTSSYEQCLMDFHWHFLVTRNPQLLFVNAHVLHKLFSTDTIPWLTSCKSFSNWAVILPKDTSVLYLPPLPDSLSPNR